MSNHYLCYIAVCAIFISCGTSKQEKQGTDSTEVGKQQSTLQPEHTTIAPGHCRIIGTIVKVDSTLLSTDRSNPCAKAPCVASIRVDSILGYGSSFPKPLSVGSVITVKFAFTLAPTTPDLFPNMAESYPGLQVNSQFLADVTSQPMSIDKQSDDVSYLIYGYKLQ
jgi:hypothetical protein